MGLQPKTARVLRNGVEGDVALEDVLVGAVILVRAGKKFPLLANCRNANPASMS